jgi:hypothetical protein
MEKHEDSAGKIPRGKLFEMVANAPKQKNIHSRRVADRAFIMHCSDHFRAKMETQKAKLYLPCHFSAATFWFAICRRQWRSDFTLQKTLDHIT